MKHNICILGGTGFVGKHLACALSTEGHTVRILTRHRERHRDLRVLPRVEVINADVHDSQQLQHNFQQQDVVINLVGILNEHGDKGKGFYHVHVELAEKVLAASRASGIRRLLHMSALNADPGRGSSFYLRSKGEAENRMHAAKDMSVTSFRPSVIFGPEDSFINRFAELLKKTPWIFPLACGETRFAPVYVGDVAQAFVRSISNPATFGKRYNLCGPKEYTLKELVEYVARLLQLKRRIISLGRFASLLQANVLEYFPGKPFSRDNYRSLQTDSVCPEDNNVLREVFGIEPTAIEAEVPHYLLNQTSRTRYNLFRQLARRDPL